MNTPDDQDSVHRDSVRKDSVHKDPVWDLLDQSRPPEPSLFFSRNVMREVRKLEEGPGWRDRIAGILASFRSPVAAVAAVAILALAAFALLALPGTEDSESSLAGRDLPAAPDASVDDAADKIAPLEPDPVELASLGDPVGADSEDFDPTSELEAVEYLGQLMAVADPGDLSDEAIEDLLF